MVEAPAPMPQELLRAPEQAPELLYQLNKFRDANGNTAFRWEAANSAPGEIKTDISAEADGAALGAYMDEIAVRQSTPEEEGRAVQFFYKNLENIVEKQAGSGKVETAFPAIDKEGNVSPSDQLRVGALRAVARERGYHVGPFVVGTNRHMIFSVTKPERTA